MYRLLIVEHDEDNGSLQYSSHWKKTVCPCSVAHPTSKMQYDEDNVSGPFSHLRVGST